MHKLPKQIIDAGSFGVCTAIIGGNSQYEEDVFVEDDLEEDEYLYQVAINFGDPQLRGKQTGKYKEESITSSQSNANRKNE